MTIACLLQISPVVWRAGGMQVSNSDTRTSPQVTTDGRPSSPSSKIDDAGEPSRRYSETCLLGCLSSLPNRRSVRLLSVDQPFCTFELPNGDGVPAWEPIQTCGSRVMCRSHYDTGTRHENEGKLTLFRSKKPLRARALLLELAAYAGADL